MGFSSRALNMTGRDTFLSRANSDIRIFIRKKLKQWLRMMINECIENFITEDKYPPPFIAGIAGLGTPPSQDNFDG